MLSLVELAARELALFAALGILIGGIDDLVVDCFWFAGWLKRGFDHAGRSAPTLESYGPPAEPGALAVFIPAWDEADVIGPMLRHTLKAFAEDDVTLFVGCYPNDRPTVLRVAEAAAACDRICIAVCPHPGATTKADCLNAIWNRMRGEEEVRGKRFKAVILHDAEDVVHPAEARLFDRLIEEHDLVQIPVIPLISRHSRWIGAHYADEFAEAHGKDLVVRNALGAGVPSAGVGCAISRAALGAIAHERGGGPFDADSLTEDYELGLRLAADGARGTFAVLRIGDDPTPIAVRAHFPDGITAAVRQKTRWITGIALSGWERLGWNGGIAERWMRLRDRRAVLSAIVLTAAYGALLLGVGLAIADFVSPLDLAPPSHGLVTLLFANAVLFAWRLVMRALFVTRTYHWREGLRAIPRAFISNIIAIMSARRAVVAFIAADRDAPPRWDKTDHVFPSDLIHP